MRTRSDRPNLRRRHASRWPALLATVTISLSACTSPTTAEPDATPDAAAPDIATTDSLPLTDSRLPDTTPADTTSPDTSAPDSVDAAAEVSPVVVPPELNPGALKVLPDHGYLDPPPNFATVRLADPKAAPGVCTWHIGPPSVCATHPGGNKPTFAVASKTGGGTCVVTCLIDGAPFARVHLKAPWQTVIYVVGSGSSANGLDRRIDRFLSARGVWQQGVAYLPEKRYNPMIGFWKGRLYVIGGTTTGSKYDLQYEPATFPWHCPEVIDESGGTDVGCRAIRALRLGPEFGWNSKVAELPFGRSGYSVQIGSQLWLLGGQATTDAQMQSELKGMAAQVFDMEGHVFLPPAFPAANLKTSWHHSFPWNGLRLIRASTDADVKLRAVDLLGGANSKIEFKMPCQAVQPKSNPLSIITFPPPHGHILVELSIYVGEGVCAKVPPFSHSASIGGKESVMKWFRLANGKLSPVTSKIAERSTGVPYSRVFHQPDGVWSIGPKHIFRMKGSEGDFDEYPKPPGPRYGADWTAVWQ